ncbi:MAG: hypothetical protein II411_03650, partial [Lachnospiraceae bacterium]|nr:hypothetical protein [Lachnospiraceae bacterium]
VKNENEISHNAKLGYKYFVLATNVEISKPLTLNDGSSICLDGYTLSIQKGVKLFKLANGEVVTFTDCKHNTKAGKITSANDREAGYAVEDEMFEVTKGSINFYNVNIEDMDFDEDSNVQDFVNISDNGIVNFENVNVVNNKLYATERVTAKGGKVLIASTSVMGNSVEVSQIFNIEDSKATIATLSIINNKSEAVEAIFLLKDTETTISNKFEVLNNEATDATVVNFSGGKVLINDDFVSRNNTADMGGAVSITREVDYKIKGYERFTDNNAYIGGAVYVYDAVYNLTTKSIITRNKAVRGSAIYVDESTLNVANDSKVYENTYSLASNLDEDKISGSAIYLYDSDITGSGILTIANNTGKDGAAMFITSYNKKAKSYNNINVVGNMSIDSATASMIGVKNVDVTFGDVTFENNNSSGTFMRFATDSSAKFDGDIEFVGSNIATVSIFESEKVNVEFTKPLTINNVSVGKAAFVLTDSANSSNVGKVTISSVSYVNNKGAFVYGDTTNNIMTIKDYAEIKDNIVDSNIGAVNLDNGIMQIAGTIIVKDNKDTAGNNHNVLLKGSAYLYSDDTTGKLLDASEIYVDYANSEQEVYRYWNETDIEKFNDFDENAEYKYYFPSEIFKADRADTQVYKKGEYEDVSLYVGKDYVPIVHKANNVSIATQYIAKRTLTYVDLVKVKGVKDENAYWIAPDKDDETKETYWLLDGKTNYSASISTIKYVTIVTHSHKVTEGGEDVTFTYVSNLDELIEGITGTKAGYVALRNDIVVYESGKTPISNFASGSTICLNGHNLIFEHGNLGFRVIGKTLNFCDCGNPDDEGHMTKGYITEVNNNSSLYDTAYITALNNGGLVNFYGINIATFSFASEDINLSFAKAGGNAALKFYDSRFMGNRFNNAKDNLVDFVNPSGNIEFNNVVFEGNTATDTSGEANLISYLANANVKYATVSFINNTADKGILHIYNGNKTAEFGKLTFMHNKGTALVVDNATVDFKTESIIASNSNTNIGAGVELKNNANLVLSATLSIVENRAGKGAGLVLNKSNYKVPSKLVLKDNFATTGGAILVENSNLDFETGYVLSGNSATNGSELAVVNEDGNATEIKNLTIADVVKTYDTELVYVENKDKVRFVNATIKNNKVNDYLISLADEKEVYFENAEIVGNKNLLTGSVDIGDNTKLILEGKNIIKDNYAVDAGENKDANIVVRNSNLYGSVDKPITSDAEIHVNASNAEGTVFKYWNEDMIASFSDVSGGRVSYSPENVFTVDKTNANAKLYKAGSYSNVELRVGTDFAVVTFKEKKNTDVVLATQYVAKNISTYIDYV